jgi:hypothetical protein
MGRRTDRQVKSAWGGQPLGRRFEPALPDGGDRLLGEGRPRDPHALLRRIFRRDWKLFLGWSPAVENSGCINYLPYAAPGSRIRAKNLALPDKWPAIHIVYYLQPQGAAVKHLEVNKNSDANAVSGACRSPC